MTSWLSVLHRASGICLVYSLFLFAWWIVSAVIGAGAYSIFTGFCGSIWGGLTLFVVSGIFAYHALNGIRHLIWDAGGLLELKNAKIAGFIVLVLSATLTISLWAYLFLTYYYVT